MEVITKLAFGLIIALGGAGTALGVKAASMAATAAWAKEGKEGKALSASYMALLVMPFSQTLYSIIIGLLMIRVPLTPSNEAALLSVAIGVGFCEFISAYIQGLVGAAGIRCLSETEGEGFDKIVVAMGTTESIGVLALVYGYMLLDSAVFTTAAEVLANAG